MAIFDKIQKLREYFKDGDTEALKQIDEWAKDAQRLERMKQFLNLPESKEIVAKIKERMKISIKKKAWSRGESLESLRKAEIQWDELRWVLAIFGHNVDQEIEELESIISAELE